MTRHFSCILILAVGVTACGKKPEASSAPEKAAPTKVSIDTAAPADAPPPPPPPVEAAPATAAATATADVTTDTSQVSPKREDMMEKWLAQYQGGDASQKAQVIKEMRAAKLTPAEKALMENTRSRYGYQKIPLD